MATANYSIDGLNIQGNIPLEKIVAAVRKFRTGKRADVDAPRLAILLSGVPGAGKTAFAKHLANEVGATLRILSASDLLAAYVGETEKRLKQVFAEAQAKREILFLDEIDSFLQDRKNAEHQWEVTEVNELLQQMESFNGVLIGATNLADSLDSAVLRRFTFKLTFDYLTDYGKEVFFERYFKTQLTDDERAWLYAIGYLTPGDFRTVKEGLYYISDNLTNEERLAALEAEATAKGFTSKRKSRIRTLLGGVSLTLLVGSMFVAWCFAR